MIHALSVGIEDNRSLEIKQGQDAPATFNLEIDA